MSHAATGEELKAEDVFAVVSFFVQLFCSLLLSVMSLKMGAVSLIFNAMSGTQRVIFLLMVSSSKYYDTTLIHEC
jgi:hypothetical protein